MIEILSYDDSRLDAFCRRTEHQLRSEDGCFVAESPDIIQKALAAGCIPVCALTQKEASFPCPTYYVSKALLSRMPGYSKTGGVLCLMKRPPLSAVDEILIGKRRIAVAENMMNPTNLGSLFRSASALGVEALLLTKGATDPYYRRCIRVSEGAVFSLPWAWIDPLPLGGIRQLRALGFQQVAMALRQDSVALSDPLLQSIPKLSIVLGTEEQGLCNETLALCDHTVKIPMTHGVDSLNVGAAAAVAFWALCRLGE